MNFSEVLSDSGIDRMLLSMTSTPEEADKCLEERGMKTYEDKIAYLSKLFDIPVDNESSDKEAIYLNMLKLIPCLN